MERLKRRDATSPARDKIARCADMVFCGTASALAISPAARPSGSCFTSSRNTSSRVDWASAASARMAFSDSIYPDLSIYNLLSSQLHGPFPAGQCRAISRSRRRNSQMPWTLANLMIQIVAGLVGAHLAAAVAHEHRFGFWGHSLVGLISGGLSGLFLQTYSVTVVTASGSLNAPTSAEVFMTESLTGAVVGGIAMFAVGFIISERSKGN